MVVSGRHRFQMIGVAATPHTALVVDVQITNVAAQ
jgi:hypothetical protein